MAWIEQCSAASGATPFSEPWSLCASPSSLKCQIGSRQRRWGCIEARGRIGGDSGNGASGSAGIACQAHVGVHVSAVFAASGANIIAPVVAPRFSRAVRGGGVSPFLGFQQLVLGVVTLWGGCALFSGFECRVLGTRQGIVPFDLRFSDSACREQSAINKNSVSRRHL